MTGDRAGLQDVAGVEAAQSTLLAALKIHCSGHYGREAGVMVGRLMGNLVELRSVGRLASDVITSRLHTASDTTELTVLTRIVQLTEEQIPASTS